MGDPLIAGEELAELLAADAPPVVLDVRWSLEGPDRAAYEAGHIPGAVFIDLDRDLAGPPGASGRHPLPAVADFEAAMRRAGVCGPSEVVVYDSGSGAAGAARAWWLLRYMGHLNVRVLDGGWANWRGPVSTEVTDPLPGDFVAVAGAMTLLDADTAVAVPEVGSLLDVRAPERFRGESEPIDPVAGHIPGAISAPTSGNTGADGYMLEADELRERFEALGTGPRGAYCGSGVAAAQTVLALERAGLDCALYLGSWSDWIADSARPVAKGG